MDPLAAQPTADGSQIRQEHPFVRCLHDLQRRHCGWVSWDTMLEGRTRPKPRKVSGGHHGTP